MTKEKIKEVIIIYREKFEELRIPKREHALDALPAIGDEALAHCHSMLDTIEEFIQEERVEKAFRWLGFIQGCLWSEGIYTIEEMANHNRL